MNERAASNQGRPNKAAVGRSFSSPTRAPLRYDPERSRWRTKPRYSGSPVGSRTSWVGLHG
jgi:hypothetical protein